MGFGKFSHLYSPVENVRGKLWLSEVCTGSKWQNQAYVQLPELHNRIHVCAMFTLCKLLSYQLSHAICIIILLTESGR